MSEKNSNNRIIKSLIVVILLLCVTTFGSLGYIIYSSANDKSNNISEDSNNNSEQNDNNSSNIETVKELNLQKCLNTKNITYNNASDIEGDYGISLKINSDNKSVTITENLDKLMPLLPPYASSMWEPNTLKSYQIKGFSKNIKETFIGELGQDITGLTLFFLMDDGTVEYTPYMIKKMNSDGSTWYDINYKYEYSSEGKIIDTYFSTNGAIDGIKNVIKLYNVDTPNSRTTIGKIADGSFYDLGHIVSK